VRRRPKRIVPDLCLGAIIDVQEFFLSQMDEPLARARVETNIANLARLFGHFRIPLVVTLERPVHHKGSLPPGLQTHLPKRSEVFEKDYFDLTKDKKIRAFLRRQKKKQIIIAGCETDVCILQSCLGLLQLGYEVYVVEDLLFSSSDKVGSAIARMRDEGAVFLTYKTLYYELMESVEGAQRKARLSATVGPLPDDLPDTAE
jgi:nicotinamidase-related amidase